MSHEFLFLEGMHIHPKLNFLILDDEAIINDMLKDFLVSLGFTGEIHQVFKIEEAIKSLKELHIDYILSDWNLPDGNGVQLLKAVRSSKKYNDTPFLMISANDDVDSMLESSKLGVSEYLVKPFELDDFEKKLLEGYKYHLVKEEQFILQLKERVKFLEQENKMLKEEILNLKGR